LSNEGSHLSQNAALTLMEKGGEHGFWKGSAATNSYIEFSRPPNTDFHSVFFVSRTSYLAAGEYARVGERLASLSMESGKTTTIGEQKNVHSFNTKCLMFICAFGMC
jgi:hypothetical protein